MCHNNRKDRIRNEFIHKKVEIASIEDKLRKGFRWFGHLQYKPKCTGVKE